MSLAVRPVGLAARRYAREREGLSVYDFVLVRGMLSSKQTARWRFSRSLFVRILMAKDEMTVVKEEERKGELNEEVMLWFRYRINLQS